MVRGLSLVVVLLCVSSVASAETIDAAIARANAANKPLLVEISAEWCGPCKVFAKDVLPDQMVQKSLEKVVFVQYDADEPDGEAVVKQYKINAYPTFLVIGRGTERFRRMGASGGETGIKMFLELIDDTDGALDDEASMYAKLKAHPEDVALELTAAKWYVQRKLPREALAHYQAVAASSKATVEQRRTADVEAVHLARTLGWRDQLIDEAVSLLKKYPAQATNDDLILATIGSNLTRKQTRHLIAAVLAAQTEDERRNSLAYVALAAGHPDLALMSQEGVTTRTRTAEFLDTLAEIHHALGNREEALKIEDEAISIVVKPSSKAVLVANRARFATTRDDAEDVREARLRAQALRTRFDTVDRLDQVSVPKPNTGKSERAKLVEAGKQLAALEKSVAGKCRADAEGAQLAFARVTTEQGRITSVTPYTDAYATPSLRGCISRALLGQPLADISTAKDRTLTLKLGK